jgi:hypothetical protein
LSSRGEELLVDATSRPRPGRREARLSDAHLAPPGHPARSSDHDQPHNTTGTATASRRLGQRYVATILGLAGASMLAAGIWAGATPRSFARFVDFPYHQHFLHDLGAFQIGIGVTLLVALAWRDASAVALTGFLIASTLHAISHANDQDLAATPATRTPSVRCRCCPPPPWSCGCQRRTPTPVPENRQEEPR